MNKYAEIVGYIVINIGGVALVLICCWGFVLKVLDLPIFNKKVQMILALGMEAYKRGERIKSEPDKEKQ